MMQDLQIRDKQVQYTADTMNANSAHRVVDNKENCHRQKTVDEWQLISEFLGGIRILGFSVFSRLKDPGIAHQLPANL
eukprot:3373818-Heterocapsa_arctica.AAC.1